MNIQMSKQLETTNIPLGNYQKTRVTSLWDNKLTLVSMKFEILKFF